MSLDEVAPAQDRRRLERRVNARLVDLTLPEFRRILITTILFVVVLALFLWMVRTVIIAAILGIVAATYLRPLHERLTASGMNRPLGAGFTLLLVLVPLLALLFDARLLVHPFWLSAIVAAGTLGFAAVGTLFAAMLIRARSRDVLLPVLLFPITVPVIIAGVRGTAALLQPEVDPAILQFWLALLVAFDVVFVTLALWTFEVVMTD